MNNWKEIHQKLFINIATALNEEKIEWTILRNYSGLPQNNSSKDVDISISYSDKEKVINIIEEVLWCCNFKFKKLIKFSFCYSFVYFSIDEDNNKVDSIKIDLFWGLQLKGYVLASSEDIYSTSIDFGLFKGANNSLSAVFNLVSPIISNGVIREKYFQPLLDEYNINKADVQKWLSSIMDKDIQTSLEFDLKSGNLASVFSYIPKIRKNILKKTLKKQPMRKFLNTILRWYFRINQFINNSAGGFVSFHGSDKYERKVVIENFIKNYCDVFIIDKDAISLKDFSLDDFTNSNNDRGIITKEKSFFSSLITLSSLTLKCILEYFYKTKKEILYHKMVIYNLYIIDILINPKALEIKLPYLIRSFFVKITPKPEMSFYLDSSDKISESQSKNLVLNYKIIKSNQFLALDKNKLLDENINIAISQYIMISCIKLNVKNKH